ncbi:MAG: DUF2510 domain-containing protein [Acidimicrobiales bacterium]|nr:DUF2510 domain-containing protein [Acidimicrobiales bacterium]
MADGVEPGWYPDPHDAGQARYWGGVDWTDRTRPLEDAPASAPTRAAPPWPVLAAGALGAIALGVMVALLLTRGDDGSTQEVEAVAPAVAPAPTDAPVTTTTRLPTTTTTVVGNSSLNRWIAVLASVEQSAGTGAADARHGTIRSQFPDAEQLDSSDFESLRPGYSVSFVGPFATPDEALSFCRSNGLSVPQSCYGRFLSHDPADAALIADG